MCIFFFFDIVLFFLALNYNERNKRLFYWISALILLFLLGMHNGTGDPRGYGYDYPHYLNFFRGIMDMYGSVDSPETYELNWPYFYFCKFLRFFGKADFIYIVAYCLFVNIPFLIFVKKYSKNASLSILWLFILQSTELHLFVNSVHRQMIAHSFFMIAMFLFLKYQTKDNQWYKEKSKILLLLLLLGIAILGHSSSYFVIVLLAGIYMSPVFRKKTQLKIIGISMILGVFFSKFFLGYFSNFMFFLKDVDELGNSTRYLVNDIYETQDANLFYLLPQTLMTLAVIYYSNNDELKSIFVKSLFWATIIFNIFFSVPLISRSLTTLWVIAISGCIPIAFRNNSRGKIVMIVIVLLQLYIAYRHYELPSFRMLPFKFIWE